MLNQNVHTCVDVWVTEREKEEPFLRTIAVSVPVPFSSTVVHREPHRRTRYARLTDLAKAVTARSKTRVLRGDDAL